MKRLNRVWDDIRQGENIELYVTVVFSIGIATLNILGIDELQKWIAPLNLAALGLLAFAVLGNRYRVEKVLNSLSYMPTHLLEAGIVCVHETFPVGIAVKQMSEARNRIRILQTWMPNLFHFEQPFADAVNNDAEIQILLLHPSSPFAKQRCVDLGYTVEEHVSNSIRANISDLARFSARYGLEGAIEVRLYQSLPSIHIYASDDKAIVGFFLHESPSTLAPQLEIEGIKTQFGKRIDGEFRKLWENAERIEDLAAFHLKNRVEQVHRTGEENPQ